MAFSVPFLAETALRAKTGFAQQARQRELEDAEQARQEAIQRRLQDQLVLQQREAEAEAADRRSLVPLRQRLLEAQAKDAEAQARGEGRYAPKPDRPRWTFKTNADGRVVAIDDDTLAVTPIPGVRERVPSSGDGGQVGWTFIQTDDGLKRGNSRTGQIEDVPGVTKTPASVQKELASLRALEADLTAAEQAAKANSGAFSSSRLAIKGLKDVAPRAGSLFRTLSENMADPANSQARIIVAGVSNEALHKKYGSALSVNEIARSELDTPNVDGDNADQILRKIAGMRANVQRRREALQGHATAPTPSAGTPSPAPETKRSALSDLNYLRGKP